MKNKMKENNNNNINNKYINNINDNENRECKQHILITITLHVQHPR